MQNLNTKANEKHQNFNKIGEGVFAIQMINHKILCVLQINMTVFLNNINIIKYSQSEVNRMQLAKGKNGCFF